MAAQIPESHRDLLANEKQAFGYLATIMPDGSPQVTPVWFDMVGDRIRINTARGRIKERNLRERPSQVAFLVVDPEDPYRYLQIRGHVAEIVEEGALEHIDALADKYTGPLEFRGYARKGRVTFLIEPDSVSTR